MPDAIDELLNSVGAAGEAGRANLAVARITALLDGGRATVAGVGDNAWQTNARLWQPRLTEVPPHAHEIPAAETGEASDHDHSIPERKSSDNLPHTHTIEYRLGDVGLLLRIAGATPIFLGGL